MQKQKNVLIFRFYESTISYGERAPEILVQKNFKPLKLKFLMHFAVLLNFDNSLLPIKLFQGYH